MAWDHLSLTKPHLVYVILGGFTSLFMLCSSVIKERMYIGEATVATLCGVIFGPHAANLINPISWGNVDIVTIEFSRIVLVVQCFAVGVELPKFYMEKHWRSVIYLLVPVMTAGWLIVSLFIWWLIPGLNWLDSLVVAACVTATDPVLASSVVGKGKFAKRVPKHLRDLLSAESGCNDGMAFPFIYLSLSLIVYHLDAGEVTFHFLVYTVLYECIFGAVYGFIVGYIARHGIRYAEEHDLIDRESFLVFYFVVALFCAGSGSLLGVDDLLVGFAAGVGFSNDGWFGEKTEESHVSNVIDLLLNLAYFVYFGTIIPWEQYNSGFGGMTVWRLVVIAIFVLLFRRIPIMLALKPLIPDLKNWREALFAGHFGPIGVGAIFIALLARAELEHDDPIPLSVLPPDTAEHYNLIYLVWPIVTFMVVCSILVHGSSIAVFTLGKRINTLTLTMSYTAAPEDGPSWMNRLPRISSQSRSQAKAMSETSLDDNGEPQFPPGTLAPPGNFLRRQREEDNPSRAGSRASSVVSRRRKNKRWDEGTGPGGPVSQSAIFPASRAPQNMAVASPEPESEKQPWQPARETTDSTLLGDSQHSSDPEKAAQAGPSAGVEEQEKVDVYDEGSQIIFENQDGDVLDIEPSPQPETEKASRPAAGPAGGIRAKSEGQALGWSLGGFRQRFTDFYSSEAEKRKDTDKTSRRHEPARAYQYGNTIIVEDKDGEIVKTYDLPTDKPEGGEASNARFGSTLKFMGIGGSRAAGKSPEASAEEGEAGSTEKPAGKYGWGNFSVRPGGPSQRPEQAHKKAQSGQEEKKIRFTINGEGQRMTEADFIQEVRKLDASTRKEVVEKSNASQEVKRRARQEVPTARKQQDNTSPTPIPIITKDSSDSTGETQRQGPSDSSAERSSTEKLSEAQGETAAERRRRLAVLAAQGDDEQDTGETPAERRRREAALGMGEDSDSDDEGGERVPAARIRFAEPDRGRTRN